MMKGAGFNPHKYVHLDTHSHVHTNWQMEVTIAVVPGGKPCRHTETLQVNITVTMLTTAPPFQC